MCNLFSPLYKDKTIFCTEYLAQDDPFMLSHIILNMDLSIVTSKQQITVEYAAKQDESWRLLEEYDSLAVNADSIIVRRY